MLLTSFAEDGGGTGGSSSIDSRKQCAKQRASRNHTVHCNKHDCQRTGHMTKQNKTSATVPGQQTTCMPSGRLRRTCERRCYYVLQVLPLVPRDSLFVFVPMHHLSTIRASGRMLPSRNCSKMSWRLLNSHAQEQRRRTSPRKGSLIEKDR